MNNSERSTITPQGRILARIPTEELATIKLILDYMHALILQTTVHLTCCSEVEKYMSVLFSVAQ